MKFVRTCTILLILILSIFSIAAQKSQKVYRIGVLNEAWAPNHPAVEGLKVGLREQDFIEGRNVTFEIRFTKGDPHAMPIMAEKLMKLGVDLIFTSNEAATQAAKAITKKVYNRKCIIPDKFLN